MVEGVDIYDDIPAHILGRTSHPGMVTSEPSPIRQVLHIVGSERDAAALSAGGLNVVVIGCDPADKSFIDLMYMTPINTAALRAWTGSMVGIAMFNRTQDQARRAIAAQEAQRTQRERDMRRGSGR